MKQFVFDRLVDRDNICNLEREQQALGDAVRRRYRMVVYGPRNYGKTSVIRNVIIEEFRRTRERHFVLFADLLGVRSMQSLSLRLSTGLQRSFAASFPVKSLLESAGRFLGALRPEIALDPQTGSPSLSLHADHSGVRPQPGCTLGTDCRDYRRSRIAHRAGRIPGRGFCRRSARSVAQRAGSRWAKCPYCSSVPSGTCSPTCLPRPRPP